MTLIVEEICHGCHQVLGSGAKKPARPVRVSTHSCQFLGSKSFAMVFVRRSLVLVAEESLKELGLDTTFDIDAIKKAWRHRLLSVHPDKGGSNSEFHIVNEAYKELYRIVKTEDSPNKKQLMKEIVKLREDKAEEDRKRKAVKEKERLDIKRRVQELFAPLYAEESKRRGAAKEEERLDTKRRVQELFAPLYAEEVRRRESIREKTQRDIDRRVQELFAPLTNVEIKTKRQKVMC